MIQTEAIRSNSFEILWFLGGVRTTNKKTNLRTYEPPLGYDSSFFGLPDTRDGQNKKRSAQNKKAELEKRSL